MPWIFLCLILLNGAYFAWQLTKASEPRQPVAVAAVEAGGARLALLSERSDLLAAAQTQPVVEDEQAEEPLPTPTGPHCFSIGPFTSAGSAGQFAGRMQGQQLQARVDVLKADKVDYWVFLPAFNSREKAEARLRELKQKGVDSFIVNEAPYANAISLGHFSRRESADELRGRLQVAGISAEYRELTKPGEERWVYVAPGSGAAEVKTVVDASLGKFEGVRRQPAPCET